MRKAATAARLRCAVYTRKSTDEGLDQEYNSIDAQRDAGQAYIASQRHEGWIAVADDYDDPAYSGGNLDRPGLKRLLADIQAGRVDIVVVYKIDRLTRSIRDFGKIVEVFEKHNVAFVSVTQQFNTTSAMGRLMLNVLLSFAQFEREVTGERIRDKIAASKKKGMWMGGHTPIGYDVVDRRLVVNPAEAANVRAMFERFIVLRSTTALARELEAKGVTGKASTAREGAVRPGRPLSKQTIDVLLRNPIYRGCVRQGDALHPGQHEALVDEALWLAVQQVFADNANERRGSTRVRQKSDAMLRGLLHGKDGTRWVPSYTRKVGGKRYRYYVPHHAQRDGEIARHIGSIPAEEIEALVIEQIGVALKQPAALAIVSSEVAGLDASLGTPAVLDALGRLGSTWGQLFPEEQCRVVHLLIERVWIHADGIEIAWRAPGWADLAAELTRPARTTRVAA